MRDDRNRRLSIFLAMAMIATIFASPGLSTTVQADEALIEHDSIRVNNDTELSQLIADNGWEGNGVAGDSYVIENLDIDAAGPAAAIYIGNTTKHVVIRDCYLHGAQYIRSLDVGLYLYNVTNAIAEDNTADGNGGHGIYLFYASNNTVANNNASGNNYGIFLDSSSPTPRPHTQTTSTAILS